jgi:hypothetical protein
VAAPSVDLPATLLLEPESPAASGSQVTIHGIDPIFDGQIRDLALVAGATITRPDEAAAIITERLAAEDGYGLGSDVVVATPGLPERFRVIGIAAGDGPLVESDGRTVILPIEAVTRLFGIDGVARVDLLVAEGVSLDGVRTELGEVLAGEPYLLTSPADLAEALRLPTTGLAATVRGFAGLGLLVGAVLVLGTIRATALQPGGTSQGTSVRRTAARAAAGSAVGWFLASLAGALTGSALVPDVGAAAAAIVVVLFLAIAAAALPLERVTRIWNPRVVALGTGLARVAEPAMPRSLREGTRAARAVLERDPGSSARTVLIVAAAVGLVVAAATVGQNLHAVDGQAPGPVLGLVIAQIDALAWLALFVAALAIVGSAALRKSEAHRAEVGAAGILGLSGAVVGSLAGLVTAGGLILVGGARLDPTTDAPWAALALCLVLGMGLSMAAAWLSARLGRRLAIVRAGQFG